MPLPKPSLIPRSPLRAGFGVHLPGVTVLDHSTQEPEDADCFGLPLFRVPLHPRPPGSGGSLVKSITACRMPNSAIASSFPSFLYPLPEGGLGNSEIHSSCGRLPRDHLWSAAPGWGVCVHTGLSRATLRAMLHPSGVSLELQLPSQCELGNQGVPAWSWRGSQEASSHGITLQPELDVYLMIK